MNRTIPLRRNVDVLPCIRCGKKLESAVPPYDKDNPKRFQHQPYAGLSFSTSGHYGSTLFDPFDDLGNHQRLVIAVCDQCVFDQLDNVAFLEREYLDEERREWYWTETAGRVKELELGSWTPQPE